MKLLSWLLVVLYVCGVIISYLLTFIWRFTVWLLRQIKDGEVQIVVDSLSIKILLASDKGKLHPLEDHVDMQSTVNVDHNAGT